MRLDALWLIAVFALLGQTSVVAPVPVLVGAGLGLCVLARVLSRRALLVALALFVVCGWRAHTTLFEFENARATARDRIAGVRRCALEGTIETSPAQIHDALRYVLRVENGDCEGRALPSGSSVLLYGGPADLGRGDRVTAVAQLGPVRLWRNLELGDPTPAAARRRTVLSGSVLSLAVEERGRGLFAWIDRARFHARSRIVQSFAPQAAPLAQALVLGENALDSEDDAAFKQSGLAHLLAVSGTHLVFAVLGIVRALRFILVRFAWLSRRSDVGRISALFGVGLALLYADFSGGTGSAWRAAWMLAALLSARSLGYRADGVRAFGLSLVVGAAWDPLAAFDLSFLLSAAATAGLLVSSSAAQALARRVRIAWLRYLVASTGATLASSLPCAPLLSLLSPELTGAGLFANLIAAPLGESVALPFCLAHALTSSIPVLEQGVALVGSGALLFVRAVAHQSAAVEALAFRVPAPTAWHFAVLGLAGAVLVRLVQRPLGPRLKQKAAVLGVVFMTALGLLLIEYGQRHAGPGPGELRITFLDVGQGDAALVDLPDGRLMLVDGGGLMGSAVNPGQRVILPLLRQRRRERIDVMVLSHPHPDHFLGLESVVEHVPVGEFWDTGEGEAEGAGPVYAHILRRLRERGTQIVRLGALCGRPRRFGEAVVRVLAPCPTFVEGRGENDNSLVLHLQHRHRRFLLAGDAEALEERELVARYAASLRSDLLKVGHHGSNTSSTEAFLRAVSPRYAVISAGLRNRFGHPARSVLARLDHHGVRVLRTDRVGSIQVTSDGEALSVHTFSTPY